MIITAEPKKMDRTQGVGASDVASVFSLPPYGCARRLWLEKRGVEADYPEAVNSHMKRGLFFEPIIANVYQERTGRELVTLKDKDLPLKDKKHPFIMCHPDRLHKKDGTPLEIKCPAQRSFAKIKAEGIQKEYILQIQQQIHLTGSEYGTFAIFCAETVDLIHFEEPRRKDIIKAIIEAEIEFWEKVQKAIEPERLDPKDARCGKCEYRTKCQGEHLLELMPEDGADVDYDKGLEPVIAEYFEAKEILGEADTYMEDIKNRMRAALNNRLVVETQGARIYYRPTETMRWDTKALGVAHPELAGEFKKKSVSRPLRIYPK